MSYALAQHIVYQRMDGEAESNLGDVFSEFRSSRDMNKLKAAERALGQSLTSIKTHIGIPPTTLGLNTVASNETYVNPVYAAFLADVNEIIKASVHEKIHEGLQKFGMEGTRLLDEALVETLAGKFMEEFFNAGFKEYNEQSGYGELVNKFQDLWQGRNFFDLIEGIVNQQGLSEAERENDHLRVVNNVFAMLTIEPALQFENFKDLSFNKLNSNMNRQWQTVAKLMNRHITEGRSMEVEPDQKHIMDEENRLGIYNRIKEKINQSKELKARLFESLTPDSEVVFSDDKFEYEGFIKALCDSEDYGYLANVMNENDFEMFYSEYLLDKSEKTETRAAQFDFSFIKPIEFSVN